MLEIVEQPGKPMQPISNKLAAVDFSNTVLLLIVIIRAASLGNEANCVKVAAIDDNEAST